MTAQIGVTTAELEAWCGDDVELTHVDNTNPTQGWFTGDNPGPVGGLPVLLVEADNWQALLRLARRIVCTLDDGHGDRISDNVTIGRAGSRWRAVFPGAFLEQN